MSGMERRARLESLFAEHARAVRAYALRCADPATADDVVSEVFVVACRRLPDVPADALPWLLGCARRVLANQHRGQRRQRALGERLAAAAPPRAQAPESPDGALAAALANLSDADREALMLVAWDGLEPARAARVLGCSRGALAVRLHRARRRLANALHAGEGSPINSRTAVALAASGLLTGEPVKPPAGATFSPTRGVGVPISRTEKLLDLRVPDPSGGPAWGMRVLSTTRGLGCVQVGRIVDGRLGVLGQDGAFADDGRFHELPPDVLVSGSNCTVLDGAGHTYLAVTWSAMPASALPTGCGAAAAPNRPTCPARDMRVLRFGLLGSQAVSITYRDRAGRTVTQPTVGPQGAYLVVLRPDPRHPGNGGIGLGSSPGSGLTSVRYRDGHVCHIRSPVALGGAKPCPLVGYVAPRHQRVTTAQVAAPVRARLDRRFHARANGYRLRVSFTARIAARGGRASYVIWLFPQRSRGCGTYASGNGPNRDVAAGERVHSTIYVSATCPGRLRGRVVFDYQAGASTMPFAAPFGKGQPTVGTFAVTVPRR